MNFETWCMMKWEQRNGMIGWSDCVSEWENEMGYQMEKITVLSLGAGYQNLLASSDEGLPMLPNEAAPA